MSTNTSTTQCSSEESTLPATTASRDSKSGACRCGTCKCSLGTVSVPVCSQTHFQPDVYEQTQTKRSFCCFGFVQKVQILQIVKCVMRAFGYQEASNAKKDLRNGFFREFHVDPCLINFFAKYFLVCVAAQEKCLIYRKRMFDP